LADGAVHVAFKGHEDAIGVGAGVDQGATGDPQHDLRTAQVRVGALGADGERLEQRRDQADMTGPTSRGGIDGDGDVRIATARPLVDLCRVEQIDRRARAQEERDLAEPFTRRQHFADDRTQGSDTDSATDHQHVATCSSGDVPAHAERPAHAQRCPDLQRAQGP
jgi:hypothetical protein